MASTAQCRDISKLNKLVRVQLELALFDLREQGVNPLVVETIRTKERQYMLYGQGRTVAQCKAAGVPVKYAAPGKNKVTWTLNSIHISGCAVDVVPQRKVNGKMTAIWNTKDKETKKIIKTMVKYGFEAGANWTSSPDSPHYQVKWISLKTTVYDRHHTNKFVTLAIQKALNKALNLKGTEKTDEDGDWGNDTDKKVNMFRKMMGWKQTGKLGATALKKLFGYL